MTTTATSDGGAGRDARGGRCVALAAGVEPREALPLRTAARFWLAEPDGDLIAFARQAPGLAAHVPPGDDAAARVALAIAWLDLVSRQAPPHESVFVDPSAMLEAPATARLRTTLADLGWSPPPGLRVPAVDQLGVELWALADLVEGGHAAGAAAVLTDHLLPWLPVFGDAVAHADVHQLYAALAPATVDAVLTLADGLPPNALPPTASDALPALPPRPRYRPNEHGDGVPLGGAEAFDDASDRSFAGDGVDTDRRDGTVERDGVVRWDGDVRGGDVRGGDVRGGDVRGGDVRGGDVRGGDVRGGDVRGGDVRGGDVRGGDVRGGDVRGGDVRGGDVRGGVDGSDGADTRLGQLLDALLIPRDAGLYLGRADLARCAKALDLPLGLGDRRAMLRGLFEAAGRHDAVDPLLAALDARWSAADTAYANIARDHPAWTVYASAWRSRLDATRGRIATWRTSASPPSPP